jgi:AraC family transcriptional regulator, positive regulator of tynA and feaB
VNCFSTKAVPRREKSVFWNSLCNERFDLGMNALGRDDFEAQAILGEIGPVRVAQITSCPIIVERTVDHIARMNGRMRYSLLLQRDGQSLISHHGDELTLHASDFILFDNTYPHRLVVEKEMTLTAFSIPEKLLRRHIPNAEAVSGLVMRGGEGFNTLVSGTLHAIWDQVQQGLPGELGGALADNLLDFVALGYAAVRKAPAGGSPQLTRRLVQIRKIIEDHLDDPELSAEKIATALHISPRYLRMVFAAEHETVSSYILRRRLEKCARHLVSPVWRGQTITDIALHCGFNSAAYFSRVFRSHFGVTPREYREARQEADAPPLP